MTTGPFVIETVCLDLDDTLIANTYKYHAPMYRCGLLITEALGIKSVYPPELMDMRVKIDAELVETHGFSANRFPESWVITYLRLCERTGRSVDPGVRDRIWAEAMRYAEGPFAPLEDVTDILEAMRSSGKTLCLVTAGDFGLQRRKIDESGLEPYFDEVHVTARSKRDFLASKAGEDPSRTMMVGDSKRSDIIPALELGLTAVHVESETWHYAHAEVEGDYHRIASVRELPDLIARLESEG